MSHAIKFNFQVALSSALTLSWVSALLAGVIPALTSPLITIESEGIFQYWEDALRDKRTKCEKFLSLHNDSTCPLIS